MPLLIKNGQIVISEKYRRMLARQKFWRLSFDCYGPDYINATDGEGVNIIRRHEREDEDDYKRRKESTTPYCFVGPILRTYNDFIFRKPAEIDQAVWGDFYDDVDGLGTTSDEFMSTNLLNAQIDKTGYILVDAINNGTQKTTAQAQVDGDRFVWRQIASEQVIQQDWFQGKLMRASILMVDMFGQEFIWYVTPGTVQKIPVHVDGEEITIIDPKNIAEPEIHPYGGCPLVPNRPKFGTVSQAASIAELQKAIARLRSFLIEEMAGATFSQMIVIGESAANVGTDLKSGANQAIYFPTQGTVVDTIGADVAQADSIRKSITDDREELRRVAGISSTDGAGGGVESGLAKSFTFNDLSANLASLSKSTQDAHQRAEELTANARKITDYQTVIYPSDFNMPILQMELNEVNLALTSRLPQVMKNSLVKRFANRNLELSDEDKAILEQQLEDSGTLPLALPINDVGRSAS